MRLYHYTGAEHVAGIQQHGILGGKLVWPTANGYSVLAELQWLTADPTWAQGWATQKIIHCDRTEARFKVTIPETARKNLHRWRDYSWTLGLDRQEVEWFAEEGGGDEHWWVYLGVIPRTWLRGAVQLRPVERVA